MSQLSGNVRGWRTHGRGLALSLAALALFLGGCERKPLVETNEMPFSLAGIRLGMTKDEALAVRELGSCKQETENTVECFSRPDKIVTGFMGAKVESATYEFRTPEYRSVTGIEFSTSGGTVWDFDLTDKWAELRGRCLDSWDLDRLRKATDSGTGVLIDRLRKVGLPGYGTTDFACVTEDGRAISVSSHTSSGNVPYSRVEMFFVSDLFGRIFESVLKEWNLIEERNKAISKEFSR